MKKNRLFIYRDRTIILDKIKESFSSVLPISLIVLLLCFTIAPIPSDTFLTFIVCVLFVVVGLGLFTLGADTAMTPIGEYVGTGVVKTKKLWLIIPVFFLVGVLITVSEPDLTVLAEQLSQKINKYTFKVTAVGNKALYNYRNLTTLKVGKNIKKLTKKMFKKNKKLKKLY